MTWAGQGARSGAAPVCPGEWTARAYPHASVLRCSVQTRGQEDLRGEDTRRTGEGRGFPTAHGARGAADYGSRRYSGE